MNLKPGTYTTCPACHGEPMQMSHKYEAGRPVVTVRMTLCGECRGTGLVPVQIESPRMLPSEKT